ncbi:hypothetical protein PLESTB_000925400 [Pleodorina starrii]|uniref:Uncharacterized protein n=1 Tax=Pleodorina starrii TaxID=330485 RepID=A0A9W6BMV8_9CHLO|nr:hypothetical protein PLESTM_001559800 [Pleodorina starrii]GLC54963.1 hypothetical protein PLESTB_000925400 [Pleodorina starrii]GLC68474.1 hypothetical protein PLESTF_000695400 [Pleodorina starrii]
MLLQQRAPLLTARITRRSAVPLPATRRSLRCRAEQSPTEATSDPKAAAATPSTLEQPIEVKKVEANAPILQKGQGTAIVTGAISAILGIGYLALVWLLDSRGGQLQPPPPEAFIP